MSQGITSELIADLVVHLGEDKDLVAAGIVPIAEDLKDIQTKIQERMDMLGLSVVIACSQRQEGTLDEEEWSISVIVSELVSVNRSTEEDPSRMTSLQAVDCIWACLKGYQPSGFGSVHGLALDEPISTDDGLLVRTITAKVTARTIETQPPE